MKLLKTRGPHRFGPWKVTQIVEWEGAAFSHAHLFPGRPIEEIRAASPAGAYSRISPSGMLVLSTQLFLIQKEGRTMMIEQGSGNGKSRPTEPHWNQQNLPYMETLAKLGVQPEDVEYVFLSHMHTDHVGLATIWRDGRWAPTFPHATYVTHPREWEYWNGLPADDPRRNPCIDDSVRPIVEAGQVRWVKGGERVEGIRIHEAPGHTPGKIVFEVEGANLWFVGDLLHHPAQAAHPEWASADFDTDPDLNTSTRKQYLKRFVETDARVFGVHTGNAYRVSEKSPGFYKAEYA
jgi:glyoxylase-like metal-dependent hydrolase (beta-lactamase superfamily II)